MDQKENISKLNEMWRNVKTDERFPRKFESLHFLKLKMLTYNMMRQRAAFVRVNAHDLPEKIEKVALEYLDSVACMIQNKINISSTTSNIYEYENARQKLILLRNRAFREFQPVYYPFFLKADNLVGCYNTGIVHEDVVLDMITGHGDWPAL